jgi:hypothetical protein
MSEIVENWIKNTPILISLLNNYITEDYICDKLNKIIVHVCIHVPTV